MARSNVLSAATWRTLTCRSPLRTSLPAGSDGRISATRINTPSNTGTTAMLAVIANSRRLAGGFSRMRGPAGNVDVKAQRQHREVDDERRHPEAHEWKRDAGKWKHRQIA